MPILKATTKPTGGSIAFHKAVSAEVNYAAGTATVQVASWPTAEAHDAGAPLDWIQPVQIPIARLADVDAALVELEASPFVGGALTADASGTLGVAQLRQKSSIDAELERRKGLPVAFDGAMFDADRTARENVSGWQLQLAAGASLPPGFVWRDFDNVDHAADTAFVNGLGAAITMRGTQLYAQAWALKAQVDAATTIEEVEAITWPA